MIKIFLIVISCEGPTVLNLFLKFKLRIYVFFYIILTSVPSRVLHFGLLHFSITSSVHCISFNELSFLTFSRGVNRLVFLLQMVRCDLLNQYSRTAAMKSLYQNWQPNSHMCRQLQLCCDCHLSTSNCRKQLMARHTFFQIS